MTNNKVYKPSPWPFEKVHEFIGRIRGKDMTSLFKLLGALEVLPIQQIKSVPVNQVKELTKQLLHGIKRLEGLEYQKGRGKGWMFKGSKISLHQLEAYLIYWLWSRLSINVNNYSNYFTNWILIITILYR